MDNYFQSDDFANSLKSLQSCFEKNDEYVNLNVINTIVYYSLKYSIFFSEDDVLSTDGLNKFVQNIASYISKMNLEYSSGLNSNYDLNEYVTSLFCDKLLNDFEVVKEDLVDEELKHKIFIYIIKKVTDNEYIYHAFNSVFFDSIKEHGISPDVRFTSQDEIDKINSIFEKHGIKMICGWNNINCIGKVSYSSTPSVSFDYGSRSPEWFSQFTGHCGYFSPINEYKKNAFLLGDYDGAKNNLLKLMEKYNFSDEDMEYVINFFDVNWKIYANKKPMLAIIKDEPKVNYERLKNLLLYDDDYKNNLERVLGFCIHLRHGVDQQTTEVIPTDKAIFIDLPNYNDLMSKVCSKEAKQDLENGDSMSDELYEKALFLSNVKIAVAIREDGSREYFSENGEEIEKVKEILEDEEVYRAILNNQFDKSFGLNSWIRKFNKEIMNKRENVLLLAKNQPFYFDTLSPEIRSDVQLMRECVSQGEIDPILLFYVNENVQNDLDFITNLIVNAKDHLFKFYKDKSDSGSNLLYADMIGLDVRMNPEFWITLNSKIERINDKGKKMNLYFDIDKELELAKKEFISKNMLKNDEEKSISVQHNI